MLCKDSGVKAKPRRAGSRSYSTYQWSPCKRCRSCYSTSPCRSSTLRDHCHHAPCTTSSCLECPWLDLCCTRCRRQRQGARGNERGLSRDCRKRVALCTQTTDPACDPGTPSNQRHTYLVDGHETGNILKRRRLWLKRPIVADVHATWELEARGDGDGRMQMIRRSNWVRWQDRNLHLACPARTRQL
jgi:hypothetical protein